MRKQIKAIKARHEHDHGFHSVDSYSEDDPNYIEADDVSFVEWVEVHKDRQILLAEIDRLYGLLRRRRTRG